MNVQELSIKTAGKEKTKIAFRIPLGKPNFPVRGSMNTQRMSNTTSASIENPNALGADTFIPSISISGSSLATFMPP